MLHWPLVGKISRWEWTAFIHFFSKLFFDLGVRLDTINSSVSLIREPSFKLTSVFRATEQGCRKVGLVVVEDSEGVVEREEWGARGWTGVRAGRKTSHNTKVDLPGTEAWSATDVGVESGTAQQLAIHYRWPCEVLYKTGCGIRVGNWMYLGLRLYSLQGDCMLTKPRRGVENVPLLFGGSSPGQVLASADGRVRFIRPWQRGSSSQDLLEGKMQVTPKESTLSNRDQEWKGAKQPLPVIL